MIQYKISNKAIISALLLLTGILTLVISFIVHKNTFSDNFVGGFWSGFVFIIAGLLIIIYMAITCTCNSNVIKN